MNTASTIADDDTLHELFRLPARQRTPYNVKSIPRKSLLSACAALCAVSIICDANSTGAVDTNGGIRRVEIALACSARTMPGAKEVHDWDMRFFAGPSTRECVDREALIPVTPRKVTTQRDKWSQSDSVVIELSAPDAAALKKLTSDALKGPMRREFVLVDGRIVLSAFVSAPFSGTEFWIDPSSDDYAKGIFALITGRPAR